MFYDGDLTEYKQAAMQYFAHNPTDLLQTMMEVMFPRAFIAGACPVCEMQLQSDTLPMNWPDSSLCRWCYKTYVADCMGDPLCLVCQDYLDQAMIQRQFDNHINITTHIHEGECMYRFAIVHLFSRNDKEIQMYVMSLYGARTLYQPQHQATQNYLERPVEEHIPRHVHQHQAGMPCDSYMPDNDIIDASYTEVHPRQFQANPIRALPQKVKALPNLVKLLRR